VVVEDAAFPAVEAESAVHAALQLIRERIASDPGLAVDPGASVRAEVLPRLGDGGGPELSRCYWSVQRPDQDRPLGFAARTLHWDGRDLRAFDFPAEPVMDWLVTPNGALGGHGDRARVRVLRYIPRRRVTFLLENAVGLPPRVIAKTKRRRSIVRATYALVAARRAVDRHRVDAFAVPEPVRLESARRLLYLAERPGRSLPELLAAGELERDAALHRLGQVHREVHELAVSHLRVPVRRNGDWLTMTTVAADQIAALTPSAAGRARGLVATLAATVPDDGELAFCQGDFVPSQILCDPSGWTVLDFDDAHHADPHAEVAALFVALGRELPHPGPADAAAARRAYLGGYVERSGAPLDPARWRWFVAVAELRYLARRLVKGRAFPGEAAAVLDRLDAGADDPFLQSGCGL
jgi:hypothetical protein